MKKLFTLLIVLMFTNIAIGQVVLTQNFNGTTWPPTGWTTPTQATNWKIATSANAGGIANEGRMTWTPQFNTVTRLISPAIDLTGKTKVVFRFKHMVDHYESTYQIGVATRANSTATWNNAWTQTVSADISAQEKIVIIENADVNSATFQFCIFFNGNSYNIDDWYFDDFELFVPLQVDAAMSTLAIPNYFVGSKTVTGKITNLGNAPITSMNVNWSINDGPVNTTALSGLNIPLVGTYDYTCLQTLNPGPGNFTLKVWISNVNGLAGDDNPANDMITKNIGIATQSLARRPLFEEFTSSTCAPCATFNNSVFNAFVTTNANTIALIKYQMNWPSPGDPYYTLEGGTRRTYYGVSAVPMLFTEGKSVATNATAVNASYTAGMTDLAFVKVSGTHSISGKNITVVANILPYVSLQNVTVHVVVVEKTTTGNVGNNGETSFKHVMMKMLPNANGTTMNMAEGVTTTLNLSHDMTTTFVEQMDDLAVVIFVQDNVNKMIFQSAYTTDANAAATVTFTPASGATAVPTNSNISVQFSMPVAQTGGAEITNANVASLISLKKVGGSAFPFTAAINAEKTQITISPVGLFSSFTNYEMTVAAVQNAAAVVTPASTTTFTTGVHVGMDDLTAHGQLKIAPNPANNIVNIQYSLEKGTNVTIALHDISGRMIELLASEFQLQGKQSLVWNPSSSIVNGVYFIRLTTVNGVETNKIVISK